MPGRLLNWPPWTEFSIDKAEQNSDLTQIKQDIISDYGEKNLRHSWLKVCAELERITENISDKGTSAIPEVGFDHISTLSPEEKDRLRAAGCFVVRNTIPSEQATAWYTQLKEYVTVNKDKITGWPTPVRLVHNLYFSPPQVAARSHPNQLKVQRELNKLWHDDSQSSTPDPLTYADACRIRPPGLKMLGLGPHIDAGSLSRWADPTYRKSYSAIFAGRPEEYDPFDLTVRQHAKQACFIGPGHSRVLRAFQGWTALTPAGPGDGSLMLYPNVKWTAAYLLLRPFFAPPAAEADLLDASKWTFDPTTPWFPGTFREQSQNLSPSSHPHLHLRDCLVSIPHMNAGDTVWWHADMCHAVEAEHSGDQDACVVYIAATPRTAQNLSYVKDQLQDFLHGMVPEDFRSGRDMSQRSLERDMVGFVGEQGIGDGVEGRRAMGFDE